MSTNIRCSVLTSSKFHGSTLRFHTPLSVRFRPARLIIQNKTLWSLGLNQKWCDMNKDKCEDLQPSLDLSNVISSKLNCLVGETENCDFVSLASRAVVKFLVKSVSCGKTGVEVKFESVGCANPLDSPAELYLTDVGGSTPMYVDDQKLEIGQKVQLYPGSTIQFGDFAQFQVLRNIEAHA